MYTWVNPGLVMTPHDHVMTMTPHDLCQLVMTTPHQDPTDHVMTMTPHDLCQLVMTTPPGPHYDYVNMTYVNSYVNS